MIHGDASIGNVLRDRQGNPVVIDLDGFAIGPREWDVVLTAIYYGSQITAVIDWGNALHGDWPWLNRGAPWRRLPAGVPRCCPRSTSSQASTQADTETSQPRAGRPLL